MQTGSVALLVASVRWHWSSSSLVLKDILGAYKLLTSCSQLVF